MSVLGGLFLIAHGLVHLAVWLPEPKDAPFDPGHSWLRERNPRPYHGENSGDARSDEDERPGHRRDHREGAT